jgi:hypothetical protein
MFMRFASTKNEGVERNLGGRQCDSYNQALLPLDYYTIE